ncbi:PIR Superfamily Protein [Plasmodium ovale wallikeri]|uniref:PIR Superfamily Protein n=2 Tax=Plasmodium ovale TaxID=36330 RepID=A0A1A9AKC8_PLAOA|nr:PIR Superfamily Protein [Plasmodium ovale wallikeri]SBT56645.1 PIR Superfamily Protein [Plasmodium ovale wallikeri]SBT74189.1 hypothetical protein, conserved [Plasmodium ovale]
MGVATIQVTYWNSGLSHEETKIKCIEKLTEIKNHIDGEFLKLNKSSLGEIDFVLKCTELEEYIDDAKQKYDDCFKDNSININPDVKKSIESVSQKCHEDHAKVKDLQTDQEEPIDLKTKPEESPTEHEECKNETAVEGGKCETKLENRAIALEAQQLAHQGERKLNGRLPSGSGPNTTPADKLKENVVAVGEDESRISSSHHSGMADLKVDSPPGDFRATETTNLRHSLAGPKDAAGPDGTLCADDLCGSNPQSGCGSRVHVATTGSSTFPNSSNSVVTKTSDNAICFTSDTQRIHVPGNLYADAHVEGDNVGLKQSTGEQSSIVPTSSCEDLSTARAPGIDEPSLRSIPEKLVGQEGILEQGTNYGQLQSTKLKLSQEMESPTNRKEHDGQFPNAKHSRISTQEKAREGHHAQDTLYSQAGTHLNELEGQRSGRIPQQNQSQDYINIQDNSLPTGDGNITPQDENSSILDHDLGGITIKIYIIIGLSILGSILLLILFMKFTTLGRIFSKKKKNNKQDIQEELNRIMYSPSSLEEQNIYLPYDNSEYSQYDSQY